MEWKGYDRREIKQDEVIRRVSNVICILNSPASFLDNILPSSRSIKTLDQITTLSIRSTSFMTCRCLGIEERCELSASCFRDLAAQPGGRNPIGNLPLDTSFIWPFDWRRRYFPSTIAAGSIKDSCWRILFFSLLAKTQSRTHSSSGGSIRGRANLASDQRIFRG